MVYKVQIYEIILIFTRNIMELSRILQFFPQCIYNCYYIGNVYIIVVFSSIFLCVYVCVKNIM